MAIHHRLYERDLPKSGPRGLEKRETGQGPIYYQVKYAGRVVELGDHYLYDGDSSYYAIVWAGGKFQEIIYGSTYSDQYGSHAEIDAPPALSERWRKTKALREQKRRAANQKRLEETEKARRAYELTQPHVGTIVEIAKGRKAPVGFIGRVSWLGQSQFGLRARVVDDHSGEFYFTAASNLRVISQPPGFRP